jgi:hypothetical protein
MPLLLQITVSFNGAHIQVDFPSSSPSLPPYLEEQLANSIEEVLTEWAFALPVIDAENAENLTGGEDVLQELEAQDGMAVEVDLAVQTLPANREDRYVRVSQHLRSCL